MVLNNFFLTNVYIFAGWYIFFWDVFLWIVDLQETPGRCDQPNTFHMSKWATFNFKKGEPNC